MGLLRTRSGADGRPLSDTALQDEAERLKAAVVRMDADVAAVRAFLAQPRRPEEHQVWETKLVILQVIPSICLLRDSKSRILYVM